MLRTNEKSLIRFAVQGGIMFPRCFGWEATREGGVKMLPSVGGITYNVKIGDGAFGWAADHIEPGVSCTATTEKLGEDPNRSLNAFACVGNDAVVITGKAKGAKGTVIGHHGGVEHVIIDFAHPTLEKLTYDDKILIQAHGQGLELTNHADIKIYSVDPRLLNRLRIKETGRGTLQIPVVAKVPAYLMGSGLGHNDVYKGDYDIQTSDREAIKKLGLDTLRFGDLVAIEDQMSQHGWCYKRGAVTIGVVVHGDSFLAGHGPGAQTLMAAAPGKVTTVLAKDANIGAYLRLGRFRT